jgi:ankyrin repeat protein
MAYQDLERHLKLKGREINLLKIFDKQGYTPLHYAAYKNQYKSVQILFDYVLSNPEIEAHNGGSGETVHAVSQT